MGRATQYFGQWIAALMPLHCNVRLDPSSDAAQLGFLLIECMSFCGHTHLVMQQESCSHCQGNRPGGRSCPQGSDEVYGCGLVDGVMGFPVQAGGRSRGGGEGGLWGDRRGAGQLGVLLRKGREGDLLRSGCKVSRWSKSREGG